jgi:orotate phosphoribosyltransferase-like protein
LENEKSAQIEQQKEKPKRKKKSKIQRVLELSKKGLDIKQISEKLKISERVARSYLWRAKNPEKYKALLQRYFTKKKLTKENEAIKAAVKNQK